MYVLLLCNYKNKRKKMNTLWVLTLMEHTWETEVYDVQLYRSLEGVHAFLVEHWHKWRYKADMDEGFGPTCPTLRDIQKKSVCESFENPTQNEIILVDIGGDYHYSLFIKIQLKYIYD